MRLNKNAAVQAIRDKIARALGIEIEQAAEVIRKIVNGNMASAILKEVHLRGYSPEDFVLFVGGGAGATHVGGDKADVGKAVGLHFSPVFCAFGFFPMVIIEVYEASKKMTFLWLVTQT